MSAESPRSVCLWTRVLAALLVSLGLATFVATLLIVVHTYSPYIFYDQWIEVEMLMRTHGHLPFRSLWIQNNEHRIPIQLLLCLIDLIYFGGTNKSLLVETFLVQITHLALLVWIAKRFGSLSRPVLFSLLGVLVYCLFSPLQIETFYWGFEVTFVGVGLFASASFAAAICYPPEDHARPHQQALLLAAGLVCCFAAEASLANGLLTWPLFLLLAWKLNFQPRHLLIAAIVSALAIGFYFVGYRAPANHSSPLQTIRYPAQVLSYVVDYLSFSWDGSELTELRWPSFSQSATLIAIAIAVAGTVRCFVTNTCSKLRLFIFIELTFTLGTVIITALGRLKFGYSQAASSRYQSIALIFWGLLAMLLASYAPQVRLKTVRLVQAAAIVLLVSSIHRWSRVQALARGHQIVMKAGWIALSRHATGDPAILAVFPIAGPAQRWFDYIESHHLGAAPADPGPARVESGFPQIKLAGFTNRPAASCDGRLDQVVPITPNSFSLTGWAYDFQNQTTGVKIALVSPQGKVVSFAPLGVQRPDVPKVLPNIQAVNTGWSITLNAPQKGDYSVFLVRDQDHSACPIQNIVRVRK